ncbi:MAG: hypothetical protein D0528_00510 [Methylococcales bacterium]|nr:MAG: hypothetical protein D0528_00510 [Methylococcales bacterium]
MVRYRAMLKSWVRNGPPLHMAYAAVHGIIKPPVARADRLETFDDVSNYIGALPGGATTPSPFPELEARRSDDG